MIIESAKIEGISDEVMNLMFDMFVRDFTAFAVESLRQTAQYGRTDRKDSKMIKRPVVNQAEFEKVLNEEVVSMVDEYISESLKQELRISYNGYINSSQNK